MKHRPCQTEARKTGITLVEILTVICLAGVVALPFTRMFQFGIQGSVENLEHIVAYNLAREKIEEVRSLPFEKVKSDFENFRDIFVGIPEYDDAVTSPEKFEAFFSDIVTNERMKKDPEREVCEKFLELYKKTYFREYDIYPDEFDGFRRMMEVDDRIDNAIPPRLKKVSVKVIDRKGRVLAEISTIIGKNR